MKVEIFGQRGPKLAFSVRDPPQLATVSWQRYNRLKVYPVGPRSRCARNEMKNCILAPNDMFNMLLYVKESNIFVKGNYWVKL